MTNNPLHRNPEMPISGVHYVNGSIMKPPFESGLKTIILGMGCFWGAEKCFWSLPGVYTTAVGYTGGSESDPTYAQVCSGLTGHNEVVLVVYDENIISLKQLLVTFWQSHDPTQGMRQGNDRGSQYRSGLYLHDSQQMQLALSTKDVYQDCLDKNGLPKITTEIMSATEFYYAEEYHQQYLAKNPAGYCGLGGTGISYSETEI
ncbi:MAG: peptide-methionine (S)-S-oxide reductase MsrA [Gammaproteobacteria bacterium]|nr:peptide-methionine (S)-S-oxide reductase MsrA [Gammaproteobacteria bacterium]